MAKVKKTNVVPFQPGSKAEEKVFNNEKLRLWLVQNYPAAVVFEFDRGNLPFQLMGLYLQSIEKK